MSGLVSPVETPSKDVVADNQSPRPLADAPAAVREHFIPLRAETPLRDWPIGPRSPAMSAARSCK